MIDFHHVKPEHVPVHLQLENWAKWVRPTEGGIAKCSLFAQYRSKSWQWERPALHIPTNELQALDTERAIAQLPNQEREAIRWAYNVRRGGPGTMARRLGVSKEGLALLIHNGRERLSYECVGNS